MRLAVLALLCCLPLATTGSAKKPSIVGKWQRYDTDGTFEFRTDGTVFISAQGRSGEGKYKWDGGNTVTMTMNDGHEMPTMTIHSFIKDEIELSTPKTEPTKYRRVK
jgi:uncharacterized protein (TIGR03066 family)